MAPVIGMRRQAELVREALSDRMQATDRVRKLPIYCEHKAGQVLLIDPRACTLEVLRLGNGSWVLAQAFAGDDKIPFQGKP